jgi:ketol-acid reductoisomerase
MREAISNTAELGAVLGGPRVIDDHVRRRMREVLAEVRSGRFAATLAEESATGYPLLKQARAKARALAVEQARERLPAV